MQNTETREMGKDGGEREKGVIQPDKAFYPSQIFLEKKKQLTLVGRVKPKKETTTNNIKYIT
jgi:hypothetical protein